MGSERLRRCPACRSVEITWLEVTEFGRVFFQTEEGIDANGLECQPGDTSLREARCRKCRHAWRPRKALMVTSLPGWAEA
jgi:hypothetical protein